MRAHDREHRARVHGALSDPLRLHIVDELLVSDRSPVELQRAVGVTSNLLAHHLDILENTGLISRSRSSGDGRRRYVHLNENAASPVGANVAGSQMAALFVCTANSARSPLAAALWTQLTGQRAISAGTHPSSSIHPHAVQAASRAGLDIAGVIPRSLDHVRNRPRLVITVCDRANEELSGAPARWHWSIADPVARRSPRAFDRTIDELSTWIRQVSATTAVSP